MHKVLIQQRDIIFFPVGCHLLKATLLQPLPVQLPVGVPQVSAAVQLTEYPAPVKVLLHGAVHEPPTAVPTHAAAHPVV
jgi:hypothetical protein